MVSFGDYLLRTSGRMLSLESCGRCSLLTATAKNHFFVADDPRRVHAVNYSWNPSVVNCNVYRQSLSDADKLLHDARLRWRSDNHPLWLSKKKKNMLVVDHPSECGCILYHKE